MSDERLQEPQGSREDALTTRFRRVTSIKRYRRMVERPGDWLRSEYLGFPMTEVLWVAIEGYDQDDRAVRVECLEEAAWIDPVILRKFGVGSVQELPISDWEERAADIENWGDLGIQARPESGLISWSIEAGEVDPELFRLLSGDRASGNEEGS